MAITQNIYIKEKKRITYIVVRKIIIVARKIIMHNNSNKWQ